MHYYSKPAEVFVLRFQIQRGPDDPTRYTSLLDCVKKMIRNEGWVFVFSACWSV